MLKVSRCFVRSAHSAWSRIPRAEPLFGRNGVCQRRGARICKRFPVLFVVGRLAELPRSLSRRPSVVLLPSSHANL